MTGTGSPSHPAPAIEAIVVAHGLPSDPAPQEARMQALGREVAGHLGPRARVIGTTLAMPGGLQAAVDACAGAPPVYPLFMADGWFVGRELPRRLAKAGAREARVLRPFGLDPAVHDLALRRLRERAEDPGGTRVLVAAHGSPSDPRPAAAARALAEKIAADGYREVRYGFVDEAPFLAEAARGMGPCTLCLPFFARRAGHVETDLPEALDDAAFEGVLLPPLGEDDDVPGIIADELTRAAVRA